MFAEADESVASKIPSAFAIISELGADPGAEVGAMRRNATASDLDGAYLEAYKTAVLTLFVLSSSVGSKMLRPALFYLPCLSLDTGC